MNIILNRIDSASLDSSEFDVQFLQWIWVLVDSLNENIALIENAFNLLEASRYTQAQITAMNIAGELTNGIVLYDTTNNLYVGKQGGSLVKFITAAYP